MEIKETKMNTKKKFEEKIKQLSEKWDAQDSRKPNERKTSRFIFDTIHGGIFIQDFLVDLLDRPPMQRLRWIKQLGASEMLYPTGNHSRFEHSLGTYYIARQMLRYLKMKVGENYISSNDENNVLSAALLHDVGHLCFSHTGELYLDYCSPLADLAYELKPDISIHEYIGHEILGSDYFKELIDSINNQYRVGLNIDMIQEIIIGVSTNIETQFLADIIHGPIDADRIDYLSRDAYNIGFPHIIDVQRLINTITVLEDEVSREEENGSVIKLGVEEKGIRAVESLFLARDRLRPALYEHHVSRISEELLIRIIKEVLDDPIDLIGLDDFELFSKLENSKRSLEYLEDYKNRKFPKRFLSFQCTDDELREKVRDTTLDIRIKIEKEISKKLWDKERYSIGDSCVLVVPKTKEQMKIGEILVKLRTGKIEKASVAISRLYRPKHRQEPIEKYETPDIRIFAPWNRICDFSAEEKKVIEGILSKEFEADVEYFQEEYIPKEYKNYSLKLDN
ncbi:MAG: HD domain-containing protein [Candidatus Methanofastidiosia archaeon]|jgi:HD superfamily phosphohydrolase